MRATWCWANPHLMTSQRTNRSPTWRQSKSRYPHRIPRCPRRSMEPIIHIATGSWNRPASGWSGLLLKLMDGTTNQESRASVSTRHSFCGIPSPATCPANSRKIRRNPTWALRGRCPSRTPRSSLLLLAWTCRRWGSSWRTPLEAKLDGSFALPIKLRLELQRVL